MNKEKFKLKNAKTKTKDEVCRTVATQRAV